MSDPDGSNAKRVVELTSSETPGSIDTVGDWVYFVNGGSSYAPLSRFQVVNGDAQAVEELVPKNTDLKYMTSVACTGASDAATCYVGNTNNDILYKWTSGTNTLEEYDRGMDASPKYGRRIAMISIIDVTLPTTTATQTTTTTMTTTMTNTTAATTVAATTVDAGNGNGDGNGNGANTTVVTTAAPGSGTMAIASSAKELIVSTVWIVTSVGAFLQYA